MNPHWLIPHWPASPRVRALSTTRDGGFSHGAWSSMNLGTHCGDDPATVRKNRARLRELLPAAPCWLRQVHGDTVHVHSKDVPSGPGGGGPKADAQVSARPGQVCAILTADCLPVLLCDRAGREVAAVHAGWRGLAAGVLERTVAAMQTDPDSMLGWLGPAIGPTAYEVGADVRDRFATHIAEGARAFAPRRSRWLFDLYAMARHCLKRAGVVRVWGGHRCTYTEAERFYSFRRDGVCGRMATLIWLDEFGSE